MYSEEKLKFSVVMALYNKAPYVKETIDSILTQTHRDFELVIVDDSSTDGSREIVELIDDPRITLISQENAGAGAARNKGIELSKHDWIAFMDADDLWHCDHLKTLESVIKAHSDCLFVSTCWEWWQGQNLSSHLPMAASDEVNFFEILPRRRGIFCTISVAVHASVIKQSGRFGTSKLGEDVEFFSRCAINSRQAISGSITSFYRRNETSITQIFNLPNYHSLRVYDLKNYTPVVAYLSDFLIKNPNSDRLNSIKSFIDFRLMVGFFDALRRKNYMYALDSIRLMHAPVRMFSTVLVRRFRRF